MPTGLEGVVNGLRESRLESRQTSTKVLRWTLVSMFSVLNVRGQIDSITGLVPDQAMLSRTGSVHPRSVGASGSCWACFLLAILRKLRVLVHL